jgi:hypothetical protein
MRSTHLLKGFLPLIHLFQHREETWAEQGKEQRIPRDIIFSIKEKKQYIIEVL